MNISASSRGLRNRDAEAIPAIKPYWIESYNPDPASVTKDLGAGELEISYHFGRIQERQNQKECYRANMRQQGAEIRLNGRLIVDSLFSEIWNKEPNNQYNYFRAVIDLKCNQRGVAPQTRTHKDGFRETEIYANLLRFIKQKHPTPVSEYNPSTQDENSLRDLVFEAKKVHLQGSPTIDKELSVFTSLDVDVKADLYIDDGTDVTVYECKKDSTRVLDLYQLLMYWDGCVYDNIQPTKGILLASNHSPSVEQVIIYLNELKDNNGVNYNFETRTWNDENILYPDNPNLV